MACFRCTQRKHAAPFSHRCPSVKSVHQPTSPPVALCKDSTPPDCALNVRWPCSNAARRLLVRVSQLEPSSGGPKSANVHRLPRRDRVYLLGAMPTAFASACPRIHAFATRASPAVSAPSARRAYRSAVRLSYAKLTPLRQGFGFWIWYFGLPLIPYSLNPSIPRRTTPSDHIPPRALDRARSAISRL